MSRSNKRALTFLFVATFCALAACTAENPKPQPVPGKVNWVFDYDQGKQLARATGKPMFVVFRCER